MIVLSHRGFWKSSSEKNTAASFIQSFKLGFGVELDIRDFNGELVVSHDIPVNASLSLEEFFTIYNACGNNLPLALNIKSDGLQLAIKKLLNTFNILNYFVFDMSIPDCYIYLKNQIVFFARESEYEQNPAFYDRASGVWLDEFKGHWIDINVVKKHVKNKKNICIVSPELHKRDHKKVWSHYKEIEKSLGINNLMICTDYPVEARTYFDQ